MYVATHYLTTYFASIHLDFFYFYNFQYHLMQMSNVLSTNIRQLNAFF